MTWSWEGTDIGVGLRVLAGTVSIDLQYSGGRAMSHSDARDLMEQIAQQFVGEASKPSRG